MITWDDFTDEDFEQITKFANFEAVKTSLEPDVFCHQDIHKWMAKRVLFAFLLQHKIAEHAVIEGEVISE